MPNRRTARRAAWFDRGAKALAWLYPAIPRHYACPLCGIGFPPAALAKNLLTIEHAPPQAMKGREVCLTCRRCNSWFGTELDCHMVDLQKLDDFWDGKADEARCGRLTMDGLSLTADLSSKGEHGELINVFMDQKRNNPRSQNDLINSLMKRTNESDWEGMTFQLMFKGKFDEWRRLVGHLKSAYLIAFAIYGYRYIEQPDLRLVRQQLFEPKNRIIDGFYERQQERADEPRIIRVEQPWWWRSLTIQMDHYLVFLPAPDEPAGFYRRLEQTRPKQGSVTIDVNGKSLPWPKEPQFLLDFNSQRRVLPPLVTEPRVP